MNTLPLILALDVAGSPIRWINHEQAAYYYAKNLIAWSMGEVDVTLHGGISRITNTQSTMKMNTIVAIKGPVNAKISHRHAASSVPLTNKALFQRDKQICAYCGSHYNVTHLTRDHVKPKAQKGLDAWMNVVSACKSCNTHKADRTPEQAKMPLLYVPYVPNRSEYLILANRRILVDQMTFLMKSVPEHSRLHSE